MGDRIRTRDLFVCRVPFLLSLFEQTEYPWEILTQISYVLSSVLNRGLDGYHFLADGILVGSRVQIHPSAVLKPPVILGDDTEIRPGAFIRGNVILGTHCVIGNSTELKNCILLDSVQVPHYNYVGDSVLGNHAHMGAGAVCSNLKADNRSVVVHGEQDYPTGLRKVGAMLGDGANVGCGCVLNPGCIIGRNTSVYPLTSLRGVVPENCIVKDSSTVIRRETDTEDEERRV